jgi:hypothetical protein
LISRHFGGFRVFSGFAQKVVTRKLTRKVAILGRENLRGNRRESARCFTASDRMFHGKSIGGIREAHTGAQPVIDSKTAPLLQPQRDLAVVHHQKYFQPAGKLASARPHWL